MAEKPEKVKVKLPAACYVDGRLRDAGEEVEVRKELVEHFTQAGETVETLAGLGKKKLLEIAGKEKVEGVTADNNAPEIAEKIWKARNS